MSRPLSSYLLYFALSYVGMLILFGVISTFISSAGSSGAVIAPFLAAMIIGELFIKREQRGPDEAERKALTSRSFLIFAVINIALIGLAYLGGAFGEISLDGNGAALLGAILGGFILVIFLIVFFMIRWAYGGITRKRAEKLLQNQSNTFD
ncbi:ABZJ_00895 family protein [Hellea balneolensis]|uniref:ABZJ_00895 family protein n=1 Tax=Hellea balneolensis TaxID=287478 RepID=UPI0004159038|nr:ABZJ_00895 family protein [Hellea balneolensis]